MRVTGSPSRLDFISLGGTIAAMPSTSGGLAPSLDGRAILQAIPGLQAFSGLRVVDGIRPRPGPHLDLTDVVELAHRARALMAAGSKGIIVSQGTDTLEEVAFGVSLLAPSGVPIVFTGAMRDSTQAGADGPANVLGAVRVAASGLTSSMGVVVVINDEIHDAVDVQKTHTTNPAAFRSPNLGPVGWIAEDRVEITSLPANHPTADVDVDVVPGDVALLTMALGSDGRLIRCVPQLGFGGLVVDGFGGGHVTPEAAQALIEVARDIPVLVAARVRSGQMLHSTYGFVGSERHLLAEGIIFAGMIGALKARILLAVLVGNGASRNEIERAFSYSDPRDERSEA